MDISDLARSGVKLTKLTGFLHEGTSSDIAAIRLFFEENRHLVLLVDPNSDSLLWQTGEPTGLRPITLEKIYPRVRAAYGLSLAWVWEMTNHQGYFDALQLELTDVSMKNEVIVQFKAAASRIELYDIKRM